MITLDNVHLLRQGNPLLQDVNMHLYSGEKIGLIGSNGSGKSSFLELLRGRIEADQGSIFIEKNRKIAQMSQEVPMTKQSILDYVLDGDENFRAIERKIMIANENNQLDDIAYLHEQYALADGYTAITRAGRLLVGLGFKADEIKKSMSDFSGGWKMRANLANTLMSPSDILLLDEPTNHLDLEAIIWLSGYLKTVQGILIVVSHDRDFLDDVIDMILHIENCSLLKYSGNYSAFEIRRAQHIAQRQAMHAKQEKRSAEIQKFIIRFKAKASKAKQAQSRLKALEKMQKITLAYVDSPFSFSFSETDQQTTFLLKLKNVEIGYDMPLIKGIITLMPGARIGLLGKNGTGKTTLMKSLSGDLPLLKGMREVGANLKIGYFAQHQIEALDGQVGPFIHIRRLSPDATEQKIRNFLGGFNFCGDEVWKASENFSGGEKVRLAIALLAWKKPNVLLLDEPANHLDMAMRHALIIALQAFSGAILLVSHDSHLMRSVTDEFILLHNNKIVSFDGDLSAYGSWCAQQVTKKEKPNKDKIDLNSTIENRKDIKKAKAEKRSHMLPLKKKISHTESVIEKIQMQINKLDELLTDPALYNDINSKEILKNTLTVKKELAHDLSQAETLWFELQESWEQQIKI